MKVIILAGGYGTRLGEESEIRPKPMVEIGGKPVLWHIMKIYSQYGFNEFVILLGYKGYVIKEYFLNYFIHQSDITVDIRTGSVEAHNNLCEPWKVTLLDTGLDTLTGGRIKRAQKFIGDEPFLMTYGDGVADINIKKVVDFHKKHGKAMTMTSAQPEGRFGALTITPDYKVIKFSEKPKGDGDNWVNAGFFVCEPKVFDYILKGDATVFEQEPLQNLARDGEIFTYKHNGFWMPMDTPRDKKILQTLWDSNKAPWRIW
ncbi:MAG: glucose-1-phosphate cytidylyltransferase [Methanoregula sp.]|jgi:glucose-1-phosphate cytidylyltransferase